MNNYKQIRSEMISPEKTNEIVKKIAIQFAEWRNGPMHPNGKDIVRKNPDNYYEELFDYWLNNVYENTTNNAS